MDHASPLPTGCDRRHERQCHQCVIQKRELGAHGVEELCPLGVVGKLELQGGLWVSMLPGSVVLISRGMLYSGGRKHHQIVAMSDRGGWSGHAGDHGVGARHGIVVG